MKFLLSCPGWSSYVWITDLQPSSKVLFVLYNLALEWVKFYFFFFLKQEIINWLKKTEQRFQKLAWECSIDRQHLLGGMKRNLEKLTKFQKNVSDRQILHTYQHSPDNDTVRSLRIWEGISTKGKSSGNRGPKKARRDHESTVSTN